jgi:hypothetical protein
MIFINFQNVNITMHDGVNKFGEFNGIAFKPNKKAGDQRLPRLRA